MTRFMNSSRSTASPVCVFTRTIPRGSSRVIPLISSFSRIRPSENRNPTARFSMSSGEHNRVASCSSLSMTVSGNSRATSPCRVSRVFLSIRMSVTSFFISNFNFRAGSSLSLFFTLYPGPCTRYPVSCTPASSQCTGAPSRRSPAAHRSRAAYPRGPRAPSPV